MVRIVALLLVLTVPAFAQTGFDRQVNDAAAEAQSVILGFRNTIEKQSDTIAELQQQIVTLTKERDALKAQKPKAP